MANKNRRVGYPQGGQMQTKSDIPLEVFIPDDQYIDYADAFVINHSEEEFIISFLQLQHPIAITQEQLNRIKTAETVCIARIALTPKRMEILLQALQNNVNAYNKDHPSSKIESSTEENKGQENK